MGRRDLDDPLSISLIHNESHDESRNKNAASIAQLAHSLLRDERPALEFSDSDLHDIGKTRLNEGRGSVWVGWFRLLWLRE